MRLSDIIFFLARGNKTLWDISVSEQETILDSIEEPKDDIERSYAQFKCQMAYVPKGKQFCQNIVGGIIVPFLLIYCLVKSIIVRQGEKKEAIAHFKEYSELLPGSLKNEYLISSEEWCNNHILTLGDIKYIVFSLFIHFYAPYFLFKCIYNISNYSYYLKKYEPRAIIVHAEFSCTSSVLTNYCNSRGVRHINVMHGEKLFYIRDSFFRYDICYVWDEHYKKLFLSMRAAPDQFVIEKPSVFSINKEEFRNANAYVDFRYYLQTPSMDEMKRILKSMEFVKKKGLSVKYRLHPNHLNSDAYTLIPKEEIEYPNEVDIKTSLANSGSVIGAYTTVLVHAYFNKINVIIDDVTYKETYYKLKEFGYILSNNNEVNLLSNYQ